MYNTCRDYIPLFTLVDFENLTIYTQLKYNVVAYSRFIININLIKLELIIFH